MPFFFIYILKVSVSLTVVFLFYHLVLRKLTFYNWNRWYLLGYTLLSFLIPFINISPVLDQSKWADSTILEWVPVIRHSATGVRGTAKSSGLFITWNLVILTMLLGMMNMLLRLLIQFISFRRMIRKADPVAIGYLPADHMSIYQVDDPIIPFSFGNSIFINRHLHTETELQEIIRHEFVHVKQKHSIDIVWAELLCLLTWYNPFAWLLKKSIRQNLEFIADNKVLEDDSITKKEYQYLLLKVTGNNQYSIATPFNFASLKKRIAMMNKIKSAKVNLLRFLFILPLLAVILVSFRKQISDTLIRPGKTTITPMPTVFTDTVPEVNTPNSKGYLIDIKGSKGDCMVVVKDRDHKEIERVLLTKWNEKEKYYEGLYGELPPPPPPTPVKGNEKNLGNISNEYEITDKSAVIKLKNGSIEKYDLTKTDQRTTFEKKYGKIISTDANTSVDIATVAAISSISGQTVIVPITTTSIQTSIEPAIAITGTTTTIRASSSPVAVVNNISGQTIVAATPVKSAVSIAGTTVTAPVANVAVINKVAVTDDYGYIITGKEDILITITKNSTLQQLEEFKKQMKEKGIELNFNSTDYNDRGILTSISGTMKSADTQNNFSATDFNQLILAMIKKGDRTYFKVRVTDSKVVI